ncbi:hypothetical protein SPRG_20415 [Saprolegnia parasitica CBS 223.65]|uniref:C3H1-type domain-containing protein n=1 Tax=Saprolegnia parasitica (strain CBS 223.65) TaxID=695850 RepID=A0A067CA23_SAPPC|nr:hypothetical protein SPRG_20415 [Saprolegnia parasitica CBS 223.65]KDO27338.1 hypothetical protein SPRG_20415 [Saprolegnia parasitica CBS 223.65]|eukprot:XP_012202117.1 hypothetical protein SPRG_20415 [Saprolegnia parasitica CBS 223.65]
MGERGLSIKTDGTKHAWESGGADEFPQLCEGCLGEDPEANREYHAQQHNLMLEDEGLVSAYGKSSAPNQALLRMARVEPYYKRNRPHLCSFFARGECKRGEMCPYLHEMPPPKGSALAKQNIKDRFHGKNDPVAEKMLATEGKALQINRRRRGIPPPPPPPPVVEAEPTSVPPPPAST